MYLFGKNISETLTIRQGLSKIHGLGFRKIEDLCSKFGLSELHRLYALSEETIRQLSNEIGQHSIIESELRKQQRFNINKLIKIRCYRGIRHRNGLPVRGQRTHSNAKKSKSSNG